VSSEITGLMLCYLLWIS